MDIEKLENDINKIRDKLLDLNKNIKELEPGSDEYEKNIEKQNYLNTELKKRKLKLAKIKKESGLKYSESKKGESKSIAQELEEQTKAMENLSVKEKITTTKKASAPSIEEVGKEQELRQQEDIEELTSLVERSAISKRLVNPDVAREMMINSLQQPSTSTSTMIPSVLERLKVKPVAQTKKDFSIIIQKPVPAPAPYISIKIMDKTKENLVDRDEILNRIKNTSIVSVAKPLDISLTKKPITGKLSRIESSFIAPEITAPNDTYYITNIVKLKKRVKLQELGAIATTKPILSAITEEGSEEGKEKALITVPLQPTQRRTKKPEFGELSLEIDMMQIGDAIVKDRLPGKQIDPLKASSYYMNNREKFIHFINSLFMPYRDELLSNKEQLTCDSGGNTDFTLLTHQKIVKDYLNIYSPYRGLLLYHGLGSGKTCSSIAIAEGLKSHKPIIVMTPASLKTNYLQELMKCGDELYKKNQYWDFIPVESKTDPMSKTLSAILSIPINSILKNKGAWLVNVKKPSNYTKLSESDKISLNAQLTEMISMKYTMLNYNGMRMSHLKRLSSDFSKNPFSNSVIIIDEAHNFVSRIVNKLNNTSSLSMRLYDYLMSAENVKIVMLSGTPIINYPNEIAIMFNILRGYIKTWHIPLQVQTQSKINKEEIAKIFNKLDVLDYMDYNVSTKTLTVTRNPFGFVNVNNKGEYEGVTKFKIGNEIGNLSDSEFEKMIISTLATRDIKINPGSIQIETFKALPDKYDQFKAYFIDDKNGAMKNINLFQRRILGLASYFRSAQEQLMPKFDKITDLRIIEIPMSDYQFGVYEQARVQERKLELRNKRKKAKSQGNDIYEDSISTYRIFSRLFCNFVFPTTIQRPLPKDDENFEDTISNENLNEEDVDALNVEERLENPDGLHNADDVDDINKEIQTNIDMTYGARISSALNKLREKSNVYLTPEGLETYSPKFLHVLENIKDPSMRGLHLIYSVFRSVEGIAILKLVFEANGMAQFKIRKNEKGEWIIDIKEDDIGKPMFGLYTGTETVEEKEIIRNIYNSTWQYVPVTITEQIKRISSNNLYGEIIKVLMITASGAEGISLRNTRFVHIIEPYWHPVRIDQVIGRAKRICSHQDLPEELRTVNVFIYLMKFTDKQLADDASMELKIKDIGRKTNVPLTSDQALFEISTIKEEINRQILTSIKQAAIDCTIHSKSGSKEQIKCFSFGNVTSNKFSYSPSIATEENDISSQKNVIETDLKLVEMTMNIQGKPTKFAFDKKTMNVYDYDSYMVAKETGSSPLLVGKIVIEGEKKRFIKV